MPNPIDPKTFSRIVFFVLANEMVSIGNWWFNGGKDVLINGAVQYCSYVATQSAGNVLTPSILIPILSNPKTAYDFIQSSNTLASQPEKATLVALMFSAAGLMTKTDAPTNLCMGGLLAAFVQYMASTSSNGSVPFLYRRGKRMNLTIKQDIQIQIILIGLSLSVIIVIYATIRLLKFYNKRLIKSYRKGKKIRREVYERYLIRRMARKIVSEYSLNLRNSRPKKSSLFSC